MDISPIPSHIIEQQNYEVKNKVNTSNKLEENNLENNQSFSVGILESTNSSSNRTAFTSELKHNIENISILKNLQLTLKNQVKIVNNIDDIVKSHTIQTIDNSQPEIKNLMNNFNMNSTGFIASLNKIIEDQDSDKSHTYFDGILGSKPLSPADILKAVDSQRLIIDSYSDNIKDNLRQTITHSKEIIQDEKVNYQSTTPLKDVNFAKESIDFTSSNIAGSSVIAQSNINNHKHLEVLA
ncbi:MAG: hypothetical protein U9R16_07770 [Campylobacterota bacterium]|nr:hypothetical protein [Campylobacterota bacterium]